MALSPIHNKTLTDLTTNTEGETLFFLPAIAFAILIIGTWMFLLYNWQQVRETGWGNKAVVIPLIIITLAIGLAGATEDGAGAMMAPLGMGVALFSLYIVARVLGRNLFLPLAVGACIASAGIILHQLFFYDGPHGGFIFENNYDVATGYILLGIAFLVGRRSLQQVLACLALVALFLSGSAEAVFAISAVLAVGLFRRDWSRNMLAVSGVALIAGLLMLFTTGFGQDLRDFVWGTLTGNEELAHRGNPTQGYTTVLDARWELTWDAMSGLEPLGAGYNVTEFQAVGMVHNVPLVIVQQLGWAGILAGLCWLWVSFWCLFKTKWKYAWVLILALSVWDHYMWTQLAPLWFVAVGVSLTSDVRSDLLFQKSSSGA